VGGEEDDRGETLDGDLAAGDVVAEILFWKDEKEGGLLLGKEM
jgi:hypothetical protein